MNRIRLLLATLQIEVNHILIEFFAIYHILNSYFVIYSLMNF